MSSLVPDLVPGCNAQSRICCRRCNALVSPGSEPLMFQRHAEVLKEEAPAPMEIDDDGASAL